MTAQGSARTQYRRAIERRNLMGAEMALRDMGAVSLLEALDYLVLLAELRPERAERAAVRWHGRLEVAQQGRPSGSPGLHSRSTRRRPASA
jgi:hypothetical protein